MTGAPRPSRTPATDQDSAYMRRALDLAATGLGRVAPNPSVGCVIVNNGKIVGEARSADGGRPHAEPQALAMAGAAAKGATVYCTLEPCGHFGKTPPCVDALIVAGVARIVIACRDPNQTRNGCIEKLQAAGIEVTVGVAEQDALAVNEGFFTVLAKGRPFITAKVATSLDGKIATHTGHSRWITGEAARRKVHEVRAMHDAVMVGAGTVLSDDPLLTVRLPDYDGPQPVRIVIDPALKTPMDSQLVESMHDGNVWFICSERADATRQQAMNDKGGKAIPLDSRPDGLIDPAALLKVLAAQGITRLFIEGGGITLAHILRIGAVDRLLWFRAPKLIGGDGISVFGALGVETMEDAPVLTLEERTPLAQDLLEIWRITG